MKKITIFFLMLVVSAASFSQQTTTTAPAIQTDYLKKSKKQKTWAWVTTSVGVTTIVAGLLSEVAAIYHVQDGEAEISSTATYYMLGTAWIATGVTLFVASSRNKKKASAASVFIDMGKAPVLQLAGTRSYSIPVLGLRLSL
jgi:uncharacterized membrane protein HdeD (DUF308 family)